MQISEASAATLDSARAWASRFHHGTNSGYLYEALPSLSEVDKVIRQSNQIFENLTHLRDLVVTQQISILEKQARQATEHHGLSKGYGAPSLTDREGRHTKKNQREVSL